MISAIFVKSNIIKLLARLLHINGNTAYKEFRGGIQKLTYSKENLAERNRTDVSKIVYCIKKELNLGPIQVLRHHVFDFFRPTHPTL